MLNSADLHETILTPVICHKHVSCHDGVTLYFSVMFPSVAPKKTRKVTNLAFLQGVFHVLERYIGFEPWDLFPLTIKCSRKCLQNYKGTIFGVAWTEKYRFEIINAVTDEPKGTIFSVISLIISTDQRYWTERSPVSSWWAGHLRGKLKRPLTSSRVNHWEIALYSSFFKLVKDIREKSMENNGDEIAVLFPEGHEAIQIT